jgi:hypothetical protein
MTTAPGAGEVFDLGYQRYSGAREGRQRARVAIFQDGLRISLGMGRSASQKVLPWLFIIIAIGPAVMIVIVAAFASQFGGAGEVLDDFSNRGYFEFAFIPLLAFAVAVGPALLCPDRSRSFRSPVDPIHQSAYLNPWSAMRRRHRMAPAQSRSGPSAGGTAHRRDFCGALPCGHAASGVSFRDRSPSAPARLAAAAAAACQ